MQELDLLVFGTGPAANAVIKRCAQEGWKVGTVDPRPYGGTCALRGCNPKKVLVRAAEAVDRARNLIGHGVHAEQVNVDWSQLIHFKRTFTDPIPSGTQKSYGKLGVIQFHSHGRFTAEDQVEIDGQTVRAKKFLIATGAVPMSLPIEGKQWLTSSDDFLDLEALPKRVIFVGGGFISFEFAHIAVRAGAEVTILEMSPQPLAAFDTDLVDKLVERSENLGIRVLRETKVRSIQKTDNTLTVEATVGDESRTFEADLVVHGAGRVPNVEGLELEQAGIEFDQRGIKVNEYLQSVSNPAVYAAGDVAATKAPLLSPVAGTEGWVVAKNLLEGNHTKPEYGPVPSAVYSVPALAAVGLTEAAAKDQGIEYELKSGDWASFNSMRKIRETHAAYKVLVDKQTEQILGAHLLGPEAAETINLFALAMHQGMKASELKAVLFTFPSFAADVRSMV